MVHAMDRPRLFLITPPIADPVPYAHVLEDALAARDVACMLLRSAQDDAAGKEAIVRALCPLVQSHGVACLIEDDPKLALAVNADGVHIEREDEPLAAALRMLKPGKIVGAGGLTTRHAAMIAGEAGVDYVMFGGPHAHAPVQAVAGLVEWWAEIFNVPCVGYAQDLGEVSTLARRGADFIALGDMAFGDPRGLAAALRDAAALIAQAPEAAQ